MSISLILLVKSFLGNFYRHLAIFTGHTVHLLTSRSLYRYCFGSQLPCPMCVTSCYCSIECLDVASVTFHRHECLSSGGIVSNFLEDFLIKVRHSHINSQVWSSKTAKYNSLRLDIAKYNRNDNILKYISSR